MQDLTTLSISQLASIASQDWGNKVNYAARPYLDAMFSIGDIKDTYGYDTGVSVVLYFLCNANTWRGETAKAVKAELKKRTKVCCH